jgi:lysophospholipase L1-like esterase
MNRRQALNVLLAASLLMNLGMVTFFAARVASKRGTRFLLESLNLQEPKPTPLLPFQAAERERYRRLPNTEGEIDFVGDSLIAAGYWAEVFTPIKNRGIGGETTASLLDRLGEVTEGHPRKAFLLVGTNCLAADVSVDQLIRNYRKLLDKFRSESPATEVLVISILPVNRKLPNGPVPVQNNRTIREANRRLRELVMEFPGMVFIDAFDSLTDADGDLRTDLTSDGLHLNLDGYFVLYEIVRPYVVGDR